VSSGEEESATIDCTSECTEGGSCLLAWGCAKGDKRSTGGEACVGAIFPSVDVWVEEEEAGEEEEEEAWNRADWPEEFIRIDGDASLLTERVPRIEVVSDAVLDDLDAAEAGDADAVVDGLEAVEARGAATVDCIDAMGVGDGDREERGRSRS